MAVLAQRLPVIFVPEKRVIAAVGKDVVDHGRWGECAAFQAFGAQRMALQIGGACLSPVCVVSPGSRAAANGFFCADEFDSHAAFEKWLLNAVAEWCRNDPLMVDSLDQYL